MMTTMMRNVLLFSGILLLTTSCGSASFFGSGSTRKDNPSNGPTSPNDPSNPTNPSNPEVPGTSTETNGQTPQGPGAPGAPGYLPVPGNDPNANGPGSPNCPTEPCADPQAPSFGPDTEVTTTPTSVIFGKDHVFHIGNGQFQNSSCKEEISQLPLSGSIYFFQFKVLENDTNVNINIARTCGVDYDSGTAQIARFFRELGFQQINAGVPNVTIPSTTLNKGTHTVYIYAGKGDGVKGPTWDIDDFIVGQVQINANRPIKAGRYGAYR